MAIPFLTVGIALAAAVGIAFASKILGKAGGWLFDIADFLLALYLFGLYLAVFGETNISKMITGIGAMKYVIGLVVGLTVGKLLSRVLGLRA